MEFRILLIAFYIDKNAFTMKHWLKHNVVPIVVSDWNVEISIQDPENNW